MGPLDNLNSIESRNVISDEDELSDWNDEDYEMELDLEDVIEDNEMERENIRVEKKI